MKCYNHPNVDAFGTCANCGKTICSVCALEANGKVVCRNCAENMPRNTATPPVDTNTNQYSSQPAYTPVPEPAAGHQPSPQPYTPAPGCGPDNTACQTVVVNKKEPVLAMLLSFIGQFFFGLIGIGQVYNGQVKKGIALTLIYWVTGPAMILLYTLSIFTIVGALVCLPLLLIPLAVWVYAVYDAYVVADKINKGEPTPDWFD